MKTKDILLSSNSFCSKLSLIKFGVVLALLSSSFAFSLPKETALDDQGEYERTIDSVVRNKYFYKKGRFEITADLGGMPYDSLVNDYMAGARLAWHLSDHFGWEILDVQGGFPSITGYTNSLVLQKNISNLQTSEMKLGITTNLLISPFYGKIRFFGSHILYFDIYLVGGGGMANTQTVMLGWNPSTNAVQTSTLRTGFEPMFDFGLGVKIFTNQFLGVVLDFRDYVDFTNVYGTASGKSNFTVLLGASLFLPSF